MKKPIVLIILTAMVLTTPMSWGSRVSEVEEYFQNRAYTFLKSRFPDKPFSIIVNVDTGRVEPTRKEFRLMKDSGVALPFWYEADEEDANIWDRSDVSLGRLIKETRSVKIDIKVDGTLSDTEVAELQATLASQLKLDPAADSIVVTKMTWANQERYRNLTWVGGTFAVIMASLFFAFWILTRIHVSRLITGLSQPIKEIGQSTKKFASNALNMGQSPLPSKPTAEPDKDDEQDDLSNGSTLLELRKSCLALLQKNQALFKNPDPQLMDFIEKEGARHPHSMGAILAELHEDDLKGLYKYGYGHWWFKAIAQPSALNGPALAILARLETLRMRRHFSQEVNDDNKQIDEFRMVGLFLCRMSCDEIAQALESIPLEQTGYILKLLPTNLELGTAKILFPGQWAVFLDANSKFDPPQDGILKLVKERALSIAPPRNEEDIKNFFNDLDLADYLDTADPRDEKDLYRALHQGSRVRQERTPFYEILESQEAFLPILGSEIPVEQWVYALKNVQMSDREFFLKQLPEKLSYQVRRRFSEIDPDDISQEMIQNARRRLTKVYDELYHQNQLAALAQDNVAHLEQPDTDNNAEDVPHEDESAA